MSRVALGLTLTLSIIAPNHGYAQVSKVTIYPSFETAGVHLQFQNDPNSNSITIQYRKAGSGSYLQAHPPVRYDARHSATSLFELIAGTKYEVKVGAKTYTFTTRSPFTLPAPTKVVSISAGDSSGLRSAMKAAAPGHEIRVPKGTYTGGFSISKSGTAAHPIVITGVLSAADKGKAIQDRSDLPVLTNSGGVGFAFQNASHVVLQNVRVANASSYGVLVESSRHCVLQHCQVYDNDAFGDTSWRFNVNVRKGGANDSSTAGYNMIQFNHIADTDNVGFDAGAPYNGAAGVTYFGIRNNSNPGPGLVIRGNRIERMFDCIVPCPDEASDMDPGENNSDALAQKNQSAHNVEVYDNYLYFCRDDGIESDGFCVNARIFRNTIVKTNNAISIAPALPGPYFWVRNRVRDIVEGMVKINTNVGAGSATIRNHYFYHNTFSKGPNGGALMTIGGGSTDSKLIHYKNNIFYASSALIDNWGNNVPEPVMDGDLWYSPSSTKMSWTSGSYYDFNDFKSGTGQEAHGLWADPQLDPTSLDLKSGSPAIDKAMAIPGINHIYGGNGPDIGAHEVGKPKPPPPPPPSSSDGGSTPGSDSGSASSDGGVPPGSDATGLTMLPPGANSGSDNVLSGGCGVASSGSGTTSSLLLLLSLLFALLVTRRS